MPKSRFVARSSMPVPPERLYAWHLAPGALERLLPPWDAVEIVRAATPCEGSEVELSLGVGPFKARWVAEHTALVPGRSFIDVQRRGPFASWRHTHRMLDGPGAGSTLEDEIDYEPPCSGVSSPLLGGALRARLERTFRWRHARTAADLARHAASDDRPRLHVAVTGASGLVGRQLCAFLRSGGHRVSRLVRGRPQGETEIGWDPASGAVDAGRLEGLDGVVHLAGENIAARRWSEAQKRRIRDSRVEGTRALVRALVGLAQPPRVLVAASATGYYGNRGDEPCDEVSAPGTGFLAETCREWEQASSAAAEAGIRVVQLRIGVVLSARGGMLAKLLPSFRLGGGVRVGDGRQYLSFIALDDLVGIAHRALMDETVAGVLNAVAPQPLRNAEFTRVLGQVLGRRTPLVIPAAVVRLAFGEMGEELLLGGALVRPRRLEEAGFAFRFPDAASALASELGRAGDESHPIEFEHGRRRDAGRTV